METRPSPGGGLLWGCGYDTLNHSDSFAGAVGDLPELEGDLARLANNLRPAYKKIAAHKLAIS